LRTDIWSFGVLIFKMLTQKLPFEGENAQEIIYSITHSSPSDISRVRDDIPYPIQTLYRRCIEKKPSKRPQSMIEVLDILGVDSATQAMTRKGGDNQRIKKLMLVLLTMIFIVVFAWILRVSLPDSAKTPERNVWRVGILPFHNQTTQEEASGWPSLIQVKPE